MLFRLDYSSGNLNPSKTKSSSMPGGGKCARIQQTAHDGRTTRTSLPKIPQHHLANCLYAICRFCLCGGPSYASWYCCLYWYHAVWRTQRFKHTAWKPGCCVIHTGGSASPSASTDSLFLATTQSISEQQTHSWTRFNRWQFPHWHLELCRAPVI